jgi:hypothetical protein
MLTDAVDAYRPPVMFAKRPVNPADHMNTGTTTKMMKQTIAPTTGRPRSDWKYAPTSAPGSTNRKTVGMKYQLHTAMPA